MSQLAVHVTHPVPAASDTSQLQSWQLLQLFGVWWLQQALCVLRVGIWEERKTLIRNTRRVSRCCFAGRLQCLPQSLSHGGLCPGHFRWELLRCACQQRWSSLKACSSNTHPEKKKKLKKVQALPYPEAVLLWIIICLAALPRVPNRCVSPSQGSQNMEIMWDGRDEALPCKDDTAFQREKLKYVG